MLDPHSCPLTISTAYWAAISWWIFKVLLHPPLVISGLLGLIILPSLIKPLLWKRSIQRTGVVLLALYLLALSPPTIALGDWLLTRFLPVDTGTTADAIVILGRGPALRDNRAEAAAQLWQAHRAPLVFASGYGDAFEIAEILRQDGIPKQAIAGESCSRTTAENAYFTAALLNAHHRILLVTDSPHMLRSLLTFNSLQFEVIPHPILLPKNLSPPVKTFLIYREFFGIISYGLQGRFQHSLAKQQR